MKVVAIHQPHYFPWLGFLDKMAKSDEFIVLDEVQLTDRSPMVRNKFLELGGPSRFLSVSVEKKGYREKTTKEIRLSNWIDVASKHQRFLEYNYQRSKGFEEVMSYIAPIFNEQFESLLELNMATMGALRRMYSIETPLTMQSVLPYRSDSKNNLLMLDLSVAAKGDIYLSGRGAQAYMDEAPFSEHVIQVVYQEFQHPVYTQYGQCEFVSNLSSLDMLFQCGVREAREIFWENVKHEQ